MEADLDKIIHQPDPERDRPIKDVATVVVQDEEVLGEVVDLAKALGDTSERSPALGGKKWFSIESIIAEEVVRELIPDLTATVLTWGLWKVSAPALTRQGGLSGKL